MINILKLTFLYTKRTLKIPIVSIFILIFPSIFLITILSKTRTTLSISEYLKVAYPLVAGLSVMIILVMAIINSTTILVNAKATNLFKRVKYSKLNVREVFIAIGIVNFLIAFIAEIFLLLEATLVFGVNISVLRAIYFIIPFIFTFIFYFSIGIFISSFYSDLEKNQAVVLPIYFIILFLSGSFIPFTTLPQTWSNILMNYNPFYLFPNMFFEKNIVHLFLDIRLYIVLIVLIVVTYLSKKKYEEIIG